MDAFKTNVPGESIRLFSTMENGDSNEKITDTERWILQRDKKC